MERLCHIINKTVDEDRWKPIKLSHRGPPLSHLIYGDDLLPFAEASTSQMEIIMECLNMFCLFSGKKISTQKSNIAFSSGVDKAVALGISALSRIPFTTNLDRYLGTPSITGRLKMDTFHHILYRIEGRLEGWKTNPSLRQAELLAKAIISATPFYSMQSALLPKMLCDNIDKKVRNFIWGSSKDERKLHLINWETTIKEKEDGGSRVRSMRSMNLAFMAKLGWRLLS